MRLFGEKAEYTALELVRILHPGINDPKETEQKKRGVRRSFASCLSEVRTVDGTPTNFYLFAKLPGAIRAIITKHESSQQLQDNLSEAAALVARSAPQDSTTPPKRVTFTSPAAIAGAVAARKLREQEAQAVEDIRQRKIQYLAMFNSLPEAAQLAGKAKQVMLTACKSFLDEGGFVGRVKEGRQRWSTKGLRAFCQAFIDGTLELPENVSAIFTRKGNRSIVPASLLNFRDAYAEQGIYGLADHYTSKAGATTLTEEYQKFIESMLHEFPGTSIKNVYRGMKARFKGVALPSIHSVRRFITRWLAVNAEAYLKVTYPDAWRSKYQSAQGDADENIIRLNQRFECDSTPCDILCVDGRATIIGVIDVWSRRLRIHVSPTSRATAIAALLRWAVLNWGIPEEWRTDNGSDYVAKYQEDVLQALNIYHHLCPPFTPESKGFIERALKTFSHSLVELLSGFIGHSVAERKAIESRQSFAKRLMAPGEVIEVKMTRAELQKFCDDYTSNVYANEVHGALSGMTPSEKARSWTGPPVEKITDPRALDILLMPTPGGDGFRTITKKGVAVSFFGVKLQYVSPYFAGHYGKRVQVKIDETNLTYAYIFQEDRQFLCCAEDPALSGVNLQELATHAKKRQKALLADATQEMRRNAHQQDAKGIVNEILQLAGEQAAKVLEMPQKLVKYSTPALEEAALAVADRDGVIDRVDVTQQSKIDAARRKLEADMAAVNSCSREQSAKVIQLPPQTAATGFIVPEGPKEKFQLWQTLDRLFVAGGELSEAEVRFYNGFQRSPMFKGFMQVEEMKNAVR